MKWQYKISILLVLLSQTIFFSLAVFHMDSELYYPGGNLDAQPSQGYSWIWYHFEHWIICLILDIVAIVFFLDGLIGDFKKSTDKNGEQSSRISFKKNTWYILLILFWIFVIIVSLYFIGFIGN